MTLTNSCVLVVHTPTLSTKDWWDNFISSLEFTQTQEQWYEIRDRELAAYGAVLDYNKNQVRLVFDNDINCTAFLLKFS